MERISNRFEYGYGYGSQPSTLKEGREGKGEK